MSRILVPVALALLLPIGEAAAGPRGSVIWQDTAGLGRRDAPQPAAFAGDILYLNRCVGGCSVNFGGDSSRQNTSSIAEGTLSAFMHGDADWEYVVSCVNDIYEPYGITITDVDPGNASHWEAMVAGTPQQIGQDSGVGGVAPATCSVIDNAITFTFANVYNDPQEICVTIAQESAHAFGFDHEYLCADPMTYRTDCSNKKYFQDADAPCGESGPRGCMCGGSTQNSHELLLQLFGPGSPTPPTVEFIRPRPNTNVNPSFAIEVAADDNVKVEKVEVYINGTKVTESSLRPFIFNAPATTPGGSVEVEVRATDNRGNIGTATVNVTQGDPCTQGSCEGDMVCLAGNCVDGPSSPGGLGSACEENADCNSSQCGDDGTDKVCTVPCGDGCPDGFRCRGAAEGVDGVCWPGGEEGGCAVARDASPLPWSLTLGGLAALLLLGRRRRRA